MAYQRHIRGYAALEGEHSSHYMSVRLVQKASKTEYNFGIF